MKVISKKEADAYDRMLDAAENLSELIESSDIEIKEDDLEELCFFLATNSEVIIRILKNIRHRKSIFRQ